MLPHVALTAVSDSFMGVVQTPETSAIFNDPDASLASGSEEAEGPFILSEKDIIIKDMYVDVPENLMSAPQIAFSAKEGLLAVQKS